MYRGYNPVLGRSRCGSNSRFAITTKGRTVKPEMVNEGIYPDPASSCPSGYKKLIRRKSSKSSSPEPKCGKKNKKIPWYKRIKVFLLFLVFYSVRLEGSPFSTE